jgi:hypothetical protein
MADSDDTCMSGRDNKKHTLWGQDPAGDQVQANHNAVFYLRRTGMGQPPNQQGAREPLAAR